MICRTPTRIFNRNEHACFEETCLRILSFCKSRSLEEGICVHSPIVKLGLQYDLYLSNNLLTLYGRCFGAEKAHHFFDEMPHRDVVSWTGVLSAYSKCGNHEKALELFDVMVASGVCPNEFTLSSALRSCSTLGNFNCGTCLQGYMIKQGFKENPILVSSLIDLYSKCGYTEEAYKLFTLELDNGDTVSWTTMISSFVQAQKWSQALRLYPNMIEAGIPPNEYTFVKLLAACGVLGLNHGKLIHGHMILWGVNLNLVLKTALVDMYSRCKRMEDAIKVSNLTPVYDIFLWTAIISGFSQNFMFKEAVAAFHQMEISGILPNNFTYSSILNACSLIPSLELGKQIHSRVIIAGLKNDVSAGNALVDMYVKCSHEIEDALKVFKAISSPNVISWTSLIAGLSERGFQQDSFYLLRAMLAVGVKPNTFTMSSILGVRNALKSVHQTMMLHGYMIKIQLDHYKVAQNALLDTYARLGMLHDAFQVASLMSHRDAVTYTSLAARMNQMGHHELALHIISGMNDDDVKVDEFSLASFLSSSASLGTMETGKQLHCHSIKSGLGSWISVSNSLIDMYGKCGFLHEAQNVFGEITEPDVVSWNGLIAGLASNGQISSAFSAFDDMRLAGVRPDSITFLLVLNACNNGKLVDLGLEYFQSMKGMHDIKPQLNHYIYLVGLLAQAGRLEEAMEVIETMPFRPNALIHKTILRACKAHRNVPLAEDVARRGLALEPSDPAFYLLLANLYDDSGMHEFGEKTRQAMRERGLRRNPGWSWIEVRNKVHLFVTQDRSHPQLNEIHKKLDSLMADFDKHGYPYQGDGDSSYHSEKLAVGFGLLNLPPKAPICIMKNNTICRDCHEFMKFVTCLINNEIIVREGNRLHSFKKSECSCRCYG
ncbi:hypothetical protein SLE2022_373260 [Rubroshorea leprosula]